MIYVYISELCIAQHVTAHVTQSHDGLSSAPVRLLNFAGMLPRKRSTEGEQMGMATT